MINKRLYYRRKAGGIIIEGKSKNKTILIWTLPSNPYHLLLYMKMASFFSSKKQANIDRKIDSLDFKSKRKSKGSPKVRTINIRRTFKKDDNDKGWDE